VKERERKKEREREGEGEREREGEGEGERERKRERGERASHNASTTWRDAARSISRLGDLPDQELGCDHAAAQKWDIVLIR
jgi:hypothetical protein